MGAMVTWYAIGGTGRRAAAYWTRAARGRPAAGSSSRHENRGSHTAARCPRPSECRVCLARTNNQVAIPAMCSRHPDEVISLGVRGLGDGRITLEPHTGGGCALTIHAALVFDVLGAWLG